MTSHEQHRTRTLWLTGVLHAFTHVYNVALLPLYLRIQQDLRLSGVEQATLLVTVMMLAYILPSYPLGVLADRWSRKKLLAVGLAINGLGFVGLSLAPNYAWALASVIVTGFGGSFYHPAATALMLPSTCADSRPCKTTRPPSREPSTPATPKPVKTQP